MCLNQSMEQIIWGSWVVGGGREEVMCLWNGAPILIGGATKKWISILIGREQKALLPSRQSVSDNIFYGNYFSFLQSHLNSYMWE